MSDHREVVRHKLLFSYVRLVRYGVIRHKTVVHLCLAGVAWHRALERQLVRKDRVILRSALICRIIAFAARLLDE